MRMATTVQNGLLSASLLRTLASFSFMASFLRPASCEHYGSMVTAMDGKGAGLFIDQMSCGLCAGTENYDQVLSSPQIRTHALGVNNTRALRLFR